MIMGVVVVYVDVTVISVISLTEATLLRRFRRLF